MNYDTDYVFKDVDGSDTYYGYARAGASASLKHWAIRKVTTTAGDDVVIWNSNRIMYNTAIWDNRTDHFSALGAVGGLTASSVVSSNTFTTEYDISVSWTQQSGADQYYITITDHNNVNYSTEGVPLNNTYASRPKGSNLINNSFNFRSSGNMTYSISVTGENANGLGTADTLQFVI